jgi:geranylgeranyl diphosphate synthase type II
MDKAFETRQDVKLSEYMTMIEKKTGKLLEVACEIGAVLGDANKEDRQALVQFAMAWGQAFQIQDDLLDLFGDEVKLGKPSCSDVQAKKQTYLTLHFFSQASPNAQNELQKYWGRKNLNVNDVAAIRHLFAESGSLKSAQEAVRQRTEISEKSLVALPESQAKNELMGLVEKLKERAY